MSIHILIILIYFIKIINYTIHIINIIECVDHIQIPCVKTTSERILLKEYLLTNIY